ncbi:MAG: hypothetical protein JST45_00805 [Bacteroidetes bacterium]|nr:hypothetical protein [Bacteroidota bacterium]
MKQKRDSGLGVPPPQMQAGSGFPLYSSLPRLRAGVRCGVPLQSVTRIAASRVVIVVIVCLALFGCSHIDDLENRSWIVTGGEYLNEPIAFDAPTGFQIADMNGKVHIYLYFDESGSTVLPGVNSDPIYGQWRAEGDIVTLALDSAKYELIRSAEVAKLHFDAVMADSTLTSEPDTSPVNDPIEMGQYSEVMKIYSSPFTVDIDGDELVMRSSTSTIRATMDHSVDKLFRGL